MYTKQKYLISVVSENGIDVGSRVFLRNRYEEIRDELAGVKLEQICGEDGTLKEKIDVQKELWEWSFHG
jgi:hypothetical protein